MLTSIYERVFNPKRTGEFITLREEAKKRDHRKSAKNWVFLHK
jgi:hypothetical protein